MEAVSSEAVAEYLPRVSKLARMMNGWGGAEYDDLYQEGSLKVFLLLREELPVTNMAIRNAMLDHVRACRRRGLAESVPENYLEITASWQDRNGRQKVWWFEDSGNPAGGWTVNAFVPE